MGARMLSVNPAKELGVFNTAMSAGHISTSAFVVLHCPPLDLEQILPRCELDSEPNVPGTSSDGQHRHDVAALAPPVGRWDLPEKQTI